MTTTETAPVEHDEAQASPDEPWDLLVIGGGTAGLVAAQTAAALGARALLVERTRNGGDCLWTGCVPSKSLLAAASAAAVAGGSGALGVRTSGVEVRFDEVMAHVHGAIAGIAPGDSPEAVRAAGAECAAGDVVLTGSNSATIDGRPVRFRQAVLAMGATPAVPPIPGLRDANHLTSESLWDLTELPQRLVVVGGGAIGCELAQGFARLGAAVTVVESSSRLLSKEDPAASRVVEAALAADGVEIRTGVTVTGIEGDGPERAVRLDDGTLLPPGRLLVALGRTPRTAGLGLEAAGVQTDERGFVRVDASLRTSNPRIWAAGDVTPHPQFTHTAGVHGSIVASNAVLGLRRRFDPTAEPRVTFTDPEVAAVGTSTDHPPDGSRLLTWHDDHVDRAITGGDTTGFTTLVVDRRGRLTGATIVGPRAGEALAEVTLAIRLGRKARDLAATTHPYPTYGDGVWNAAVADVRRSLREPTTARAIGLLARVRRTWLDHRPGR